MRCTVTVHDQGNAHFSNYMLHLTIILKCITYNTKDLSSVEVYPWLYITAWWVWNEAPKSGWSQILQLSVVIRLPKVVSIFCLPSTSKSQSGFGWTNWCLHSKNDPICFAKTLQFEAISCARSSTKDRPAYANSMWCKQPLIAMQG